MNPSYKPGKLRSVIDPTDTIPVYRTLYPHVDPPSREFPSGFSLWFRQLFHFVIGDSTISSFNHDGEKPQCYGQHAYAVPINPDGYTSEHIHRLLTSPYSLNLGPTVDLVDGKTVVKSYIVGEAAIADALNIEMVRQMTTIPVPRVKFVATSSASHTAHLFMEYIGGEPLDQIWPTLNFFSRFRVAWTLRGYVMQLCRLRRDTPGTLNGTDCQGRMFPISIDVESFKSRDDMTDWINRRLDVCKRAKKARPDAPRFDGNWDIVFTHGDIIPRNIVVANDGTLYLVDWTFSGFYPDWFEYASMMADQFSQPPSWNVFIPFICGALLGHTKRLTKNYFDNVYWAIASSAMV